MAVYDLSSALFGKTRRAVLALFYTHPDRSFYVREVARAVGIRQGAVQRELRRLSEAGIISRSGRGQQVHYQASRECPIFAELRGIAVKTAGVADVLRDALAPLADRIEVAFVYGSLARGDERADSDVDLLVVGEITFADTVSALSAAQETIGREVNPSVFPLPEFRKKLAADHHFLRTVMSGPKVFLLGDERVLAAVAE